MRVDIKATNVFKFSELSESAQQTALEKQASFESEVFDHECIYDDAMTIFKLIGFEFNDEKQPFYYSGFSSQGDGACIANASYSFAKGA